MSPVSRVPVVVILFSVLLVGALEQAARAETLVLQVPSRATVKVRNLATGETEVRRASRSGSVVIDASGAYHIEVPSTGEKCFVFVGSRDPGTRNVILLRERAASVDWWQRRARTPESWSEAEHRAIDPYAEASQQAGSDQQHFDAAHAAKLRVIEMLRVVLVAGYDTDAYELVHFLNVLEVTEENFAKEIEQHGSAAPVRGGSEGPGEGATQHANVDQDLRGDWMDAAQHGSLRITRDGDHFVATILDPGTSAKRGFRSGEQAFSVSPLGGDSLTGEITLRYPVEDRARCPEQWSRIVPMQGKILAQGDRLSISYPSGRLQESCEISGGDPDTWVLERAPERDPRELRFRRDGAPQAIPVDEPLPYGEPLRLEAIYDEPPARDHAVVTLDWKGAPVIPVLVERSSADPLLFRSDVLTLRQPVDCGGETYCTGPSMDWGGWSE